MPSVLPLLPLAALLASLLPAASAAQAPALPETAPAAVPSLGAQIAAQGNEALHRLKKEARRPPLPHLLTPELEMARAPETQRGP